MAMSDPHAGRALEDAVERIAALDRRAEHRRVAFAPNATMAWRRFGVGPPLVLVHGGHGSWLHWVRNIEALSRGHALWVPDLPGYGDSDALAPGDRLDAHVGALMGSLDELLGPGAAIDLAGFSFGGLVAAATAARRGAIRRLALIGTAGHGGPRRLTQSLRKWRTLDDAGRSAAFRHNLAALMVHDAPAIDALALAAYEASCRATRFHSRTLSLDASIASLLADFASPVLFAWGEHDVTTTPSVVAAELTRDRPQRRAVIVEGAGHWVQYERSSALDALLSDWFAEDSRA
jgi:pimeloyl-ACP methyl ester carboxylesterase